MFGLLKFLFYTCVAVVVGVVIGTVPIGGHTVAERIAHFYQGTSALAEVIAPARKEAGAAKVAPKAAARTTPRAKGSAAPAPTPEPTPSAPAAAAPALKPTSAGAANSPDAQSDDEKAQLDQVIAARVHKK